MKTSKWVPWVYVGPAALVMAAACLYPVISALQLGFYDWSIGTPWSDARWMGFDTFARVLQEPAVWRSLRITLLFAFVCVSAEMMLGIALALALGVAVDQLGIDFKLIYSTTSMVAAFACSTLIGVAFGFLPARNAARLDPVEALARD